MDNREYIELFYERIYEKDVNNKILDDKNYIVPRQQLLDYINKLIEIPYIGFLNYIKEHSQAITYDKSDITQCSSFSACEIEMCNALLWGNNPGYQFIDIGKLFPTYVKTRNDGAYRKYGENQVKTASQLGITFEYYNYWYLSCLGYIYPELNQQQKDSLLARTISRNPLYQKILADLLDKDIDLADYLSILSSVTQKRRLGSVITLLNFCLKECHKDGIAIHSIKGKEDVDNAEKEDVKPVTTPVRKKRVKRIDATIHGVRIIGEDEKVYLEVLRIIGYGDLLIKRIQLSGIRIVTTTKQFRKQINCGNYWISLPQRSSDMIKWLKIIAAVMKEKLTIRQAKAYQKDSFPELVETEKTTSIGEEYTLKSYTEALDYAVKTLMNEHRLTLKNLKKVTPAFANDVYIKVINSGIGLEEKPGVLNYNKLWGVN